MNDMDPHTLREIIFKSPEHVSDLIKSVAHAHRLRILVLLLDGPQEFSHLLDAVKISKTALANHLTHMMDKGVIERSERGMYQITADGKDLITAVATFYEHSTARELNRVNQIKKQYAQGYKGMSRKIHKNSIANPPVIQDCWLTYIGAVTGVLQWLGVDCDIIDVGGYSGYVFLLNVAKGITCASGPTAHNAWEEIHRGTERLGWSLTSISDEQSYPLSEKATPEDRARAWHFFEVVKKEIDKGSPVVLWGIPVPEYGIVTGYEGDSYTVSTVRRFTGQPELPVRYDALQAPGCMEAIFFNEKIPVPEERDKDAIDSALTMAEGNYALKGYVQGLEAYDEWVTVLEGGKSEVDYFGNSYVGACLHDARRIAAQFLERMTQKYESHCSSLKKAAHYYNEAATLLGTFTEMFPFPQSEAAPDYSKGAEILRAVKESERAAMQQLRKAFQQWGH